MPEEQEGVIVESPATEEAVNVEEVENQPAQQEEVITEQEQNVVGVSDLSAIGDDGVPAINRENEWKRKHEELAQRMPEYIDQAVSEAARVFAEQQQKAHQEPQMSQEQLRGILLDDSGTYTTGNKIWAQEQLDKLNEQKMAKLLDEKFNLSQKSQQEARLKAESEAYVIKTFPEMFQRDVNGNIVGWNNENPMTKLTANYMKQLGNRPDALREAARQAFVDFQLNNKTQSTKKVQLAKSEAAQTKRQQIGAGTGNADINVMQNEVAAAYEKFKKSGNVQDAVAYNKLKGRLAAKKLKG